jgi:hypothetical protein
MLGISKKPAEAEYEIERDTGERRRKLGDEHSK